MIFDKRPTAKGAEMIGGEDISLQGPLDGPERPTRIDGHQERRALMAYGSPRWPRGRALGWGAALLLLGAAAALWVWLAAAGFLG